MSMSPTLQSTEQGQTYQNDEIVGYYQKSTVADLDEAVAAARQAQPGWAATPAPERGEILLRTALLLEQQKEELATLMTREMGRVIKETRGDIQTAIDVAKFIAGEGRRAEGETIPSALNNKFCMTIRQPLGGVGIITP